MYKRMSQASRKGRIFDDVLRHAKLWAEKVGNSLRKLVLIKLADNANDKGECWPSYQHIADQNAAERLFVTILMRLKKWVLSSVRTRRRQQRKR
jgi:hypothetical protein